LGICYKSGQGVTKDEKKAVYWYTKAAEQGDADAQCNLGNCYFNGEGVAVDYDKAWQLWAVAAEQGQAIARKNLNLLKKSWITGKYVRK
jgi:TPR repeat protein